MTTTGLIISGYTDAQIDKLDQVFRVLRNTWSMSKKDLLKLIRSRYVHNLHVDEEDIINFFEIFKFPRSLRLKFRYIKFEHFKKIYDVFLIYM